tara:strand:+ start:9668 stop:9841 length:174 start_codon:yes stop_codon:yes gene_type:complete
MELDSLFSITSEFIVCENEVEVIRTEAKRSGNVFIVTYFSAKITNYAKQKNYPFCFN